MPPPSPPSVRGRLRRLRNRFRRDHRDPEAFHPDLKRELEEWTSVAEQGLKLVGASLVQSWEVTLAELRPTLVRFNGQEAGGEMVNRWSDALVPIETPYQALIRNCPALLTQGLAQAEATGKLAPLTEVLLTRIEELGPLTAEGWLRTLGHVDPILDTLPNAGAIKNRIQAEGPRLGQQLAEAAAQLRKDFGQAGHSDRVGSALFHAIDTWKDTVIRSIEFAVAVQLEAVEALSDQA